MFFPPPSGQRHLEPHLDFSFWLVFNFDFKLFLLGYLYADLGGKLGLYCVLALQAFNGKQVGSLLYRLCLIHFFDFVDQPHNYESQTCQHHKEQQDDDGIGHIEGRLHQSAVSVGLP